MIDMVNHPSHYETGKFECIEVMVETQGKEAVMDFCLCNAFKYLYRHNRKNGIEDIKKTKWYLDKYLELAGDDSSQSQMVETNYDRIRNMSIAEMADFLLVASNCMGMECEGCPFKSVMCSTFDGLKGWLERMA